MTSATASCGVLLAGFVLWRSWRERRVRAIVALVTAYAAFAFGRAALTGTTLGAALAGAGQPHLIPRVLQSAFIGAFIVLPLGWIAALVQLGIPRFRAGSPRRALYQALALTVCVALVGTSLPQPRASIATTPPESGLSRADRLRMLDNSLRAIEDGDREASRDRWDPDYVVQMVGRDPQKLFEWVRDNTSWIPYHGVLRGPVGVLMDRQGNSLDRALLLAALLEKTGQTVRLAHAELTRSQALDLLPTLVVDRQLAFAPRTLFERKAAADPAPQQMADEYRLDGAAMNETLRAQAQTVSRMFSELHARVTNQTGRLLKAVAGSKSDEGPDRTAESAISGFVDHWWVQRREGLNWLDLDLVSDAARPARALAGANETLAVNDLPDAMRHEVTVRVIAEQWARGKLREYKALEHTLRPADVIGQSVTLRFWPTEWTADEKGARSDNDWKADILAQKQWDAVLAVEGKVLATATISDSGDDPSAVKGGDYGSLASSFASSMNVPSHAGAGVLSAVWLEYEIRVPGDKAQTIRRTVFDLLGPAERATLSPQLSMNTGRTLTRSLALTMQTEILPVVSALAPEFVTHLLAQNLLENRDLLAFLLRGTLPADASSLDRVFDRSTPPVSPLYSVALARFGWGKQEDVFIDRPNVLTRHMYVVASEQNLLLREATDIVANDVGVGLAAHDSFAARLEQGVLDTNIEALLQPPALRFGNAGDAFDKSQRWMVVAPNQDAASVERLHLPPGVRRQIAIGRAEGYVAVAPETPVPMQVEPFAGWWRIDPFTGNALGLGANGWGQDGVERGVEDARVAKIAPTWLTRIKRFAVKWAVASSGNYGWCLAPLVAREVEDSAKLGHSLAIWAHAVKPSVEQCGANSIVLGGLTAWLLPTGVVEEEGPSQPFEPKDPPPPKPPCPPDDAIPPSEEPEANLTQGQKEPPVPEPPEVEGPVQPSEEVRLAKDAEWAAEQAFDDASKIARQDLGDLIRYRANKPSVAERTGGDPSHFDPAEYARLQDKYDAAQKLADLRHNEWEQAKQVLKQARDAQARARGQAGRSGLACGWGPSPQDRLPAGGQKPNLASGAPAPGAGEPPEAPKPQPERPPGEFDPGSNVQPAGSEPDPATVRDPQPGEQDGPPTVRDPFANPAHAPTDPATPAWHKINVNDAGPRNPTLPAVPPARKTLIGVNSALKALGGP